MWLTDQSERAVYFCYVIINIVRQNGYAKQNVILLHFLANEPLRELSKIRKKRKTFYTQGTIRENAELSPAIKTKHSRKSPHPFKVRHSNNASSLSNVDSVVGCSLKLFGSLARDFFATLPKVNMKVEISELQPGIL